LFWLGAEVGIGGVNCPARSPNDGPDSTSASRNAVDEVRLQIAVWLRRLPGGPAREASATVSPIEMAAIISAGPVLAFA